MIFAKHEAWSFILNSCKQIWGVETLSFLWSAPADTLPRCATNWGDKFWEQNASCLCTGRKRVDPAELIFQHQVVAAGNRNTRCDHFAERLYRVETSKKMTKGFCCNDIKIPLFCVAEIENMSWKTFRLRWYWDTKYTFTPRQFESFKSVLWGDFCGCHWVAAVLATWQNGPCLGTVAIGKPDRHVRKASHCGSKQQ